MATLADSTNAATQSVGSISDALMQMVYSVIAYIPNIIAAVIILIIGWKVGRLLGKVISGILDKIGVDDALLKTSVGKAIEQSRTSVVTFFDLIVRWFIYLNRNCRSRQCSSAGVPHHPLPEHCGLSAPHCDVPHYPDCRIYYGRLLRRSP